MEAFLDASGLLSQSDMVKLRNIVRRTELPDAPDSDVELLLQQALDSVHIPQPSGGPARLLAEGDSPPAPADARATTTAKPIEEDSLDGGCETAAAGSARAAEVERTHVPTSSGTGVLVKMPALGASTTEGTVTRWLKAMGDTVDVDEPLLEVSTDKIDTEIPSPVAGVLEEVLVPEDKTVKVGANLAVIGPRPAPRPPRAALSNRLLEPTISQAWSKWRSLGRRVEVTRIAGSRGGRHTHTLFGLTPGSGSPVAWSATTDSVTAQWKSGPFPAPPEGSATIARRARAGSIEQQRFVGLTSFSSDPGHQAVFLASATGDLFASHRQGGTPWSRWQHIWTGPLIREISGSGVWPGHAAVFALTTDSRLLSAGFKAGESPVTWNEIDMPAPGRYVSLSASSPGPGFQDLVVVAADGSLYRRFSFGKWSPWQKFGEIPNTRQVIALRATPDEQSVFALTSDSRLLSSRQRSTADTDAWEEIELPSNDLYVGIAAYSLTPGRFFLFAASESGSVHFKKLTIAGSRDHDARAEQNSERARDHE